MYDFISEGDLKTFEGYLKYQAIDAARLKPEELKQWHEIFEQARQRTEASPKVGRMKLPCSGIPRNSVMGGFWPKVG